MLIAIFSILMTANVFAFEVESDVCPNVITQTDDLLICSKSAYTIMDKGNKTEDVKNVSFETLDHLSFGYPDDSTNLIYSYLKEVKNKSGKLIGYLDIFAITNSEAGWRVQLKIYYNLKGKVVGGTSSDF